MKRLALAAALALPALAGCGGEQDPAATPVGVAEIRLIENLFDGRFGRAYADLHPAHQRVVSRASFVRCSRQRIAVGKLESIEVLDLFDEDIRIAGVAERRAKAVRVRVTSSSGESFTSLQHWVKVAGRWRWVLSSAAVRAFRSGACPAGSP